MNFLQAFGIIRQALTIGGTLLTANGLASSDTIGKVTGASNTGEAVAGLAALAASVAWSYYQNHTPVVQKNAAKLGK